MKRLPLFAVALAALLCTASAGRADLIAWAYNWTPTTPTVLSDSPGSGKILLSNDPTGSAVNSSNIVATDIRTASTATLSSPDTFTNRPYGLTLSITDKASHATGSLTFTGVFNGTLTAFSSNITNSFTGPQTQTLLLGTNVYKVTMGAYSPPPPTGAVNSGAISAFAQVTVQPGGTPPPGGTPSAPEPSSLALAALGLSLAGGALWRRGRGGDDRVALTPG